MRLSSDFSHNVITTINAAASSESHFSAFRRCLARLMTYAAETGTRLGWLTLPSRLRPESSRFASSSPSSWTIFIATSGTPSPSPDAFQTCPNPPDPSFEISLKSRSATGFSPSQNFNGSESDIVWNLPLADGSPQHCQEKWPVAHRGARTDPHRVAIVTPVTLLHATHQITSRQAARGDGS